MISPLELLLALVVGATVALSVVKVVDWLIKSLPSAILPGFLLLMVFVCLGLFALAAVVRAGRLP